MRAYPRSTTWPYVLLVLCVFVSAVRAPRDFYTRVSEEPFSRKAWQTFWPSAATPPGALASSLAFAAPVDGIKPAAQRQATELQRPHLRVAAESVTVKAAHLEPLSLEPHPRAGQTDLEEPAHGDRVEHATATVDEPLPSAPMLTDPLEDRTELPVLDYAELETVLPAHPSPSVQNQVTVPASPWPRCTALVQSLQQLQSADLPPQLHAWTSQVLEQLALLEHTSRLADQAARPILDQLAQLAASPYAAAPPTENVQTAAAVRRAGWALTRRLVIWNLVYRAAGSASEAGSGEALAVSTAPSVDRLSQQLQEIDQQLSGPHREGWRDYLLMDRLHQLAAAGWSVERSAWQRVARQLLNRLQHPQLDKAQRRFLQRPVIHSLQTTLSRWAAEPVDYPALLLAIEQFEHSRSWATSQHLVQHVESLRWSDQPGDRELHASFNTHYRNANIRLTLSEELINRLLPVVRPVEETVRDTFLGAQVAGHNSTWAQLGIEFVPDPQQIRLRLRAIGRTQSRTVSTKGPVRLYNRGRSAFQADKQLILAPHGVFVTRAQANARGRSNLLNVETDYDDIPLLGWILREMAIDEHNDRQGLVRELLQQRVSQEAQQKLDEAVHERLSGAEERVQEKLLTPLRRLQLDPRAMEMRTTPERIILRCRLCSHDQLAAYTPRPRAHRNCDLSFQMHESAANNLLAKLNLNGQRIELEQLIQRLQQTLGIDRQDIAEEIPEDVVLRLGTDRPIFFTFDDQRVLLTVRITELTTRRNTWRNFVVRGRYRADIDGTEVALERDGGIELISETLGFRDQIALRGIFTKVLARNHRLQILQGRFESDPRLSHLAVTQFVAQDGWIGLSVGTPRRDRVAAGHPLSAR